MSSLVQFEEPKSSSWLVTFVLYLVATRWLASSSAASVSPSLSVTGEHSTSPSRSVRSPVWSFFAYDAATEKSICQVELSDHVICVHNISGKYPTNLKQHLKKSICTCQYHSHPETWKIIAKHQPPRSHLGARMNRCSNTCDSFVSRDKISSTPNNHR